MIVYQTDAGGYYKGPVEADESPLEPGVFLIPGGAVTTPPPDPADIPPGWAARWVGNQWKVTNILPTPTVPNPPDLTPEEQLQLLRGSMTAYRRAFRLALKDQPVTESPTLNFLFPNAAHLLEAADMYIATLSPYDALAAAWHDVVQFLRLHPDIIAAQTAMQLTDEQIDSYFLAAQAYE